MRTGCSRLCTDRWGVHGVHLTNVQSSHITLRVQVPTPTHTHTHRHTRTHVVCQPARPMYAGFVHCLHLAADISFNNCELAHYVYLPTCCTILKCISRKLYSALMYVNIMYAHIYVHMLLTCILDTLSVGSGC